MARIHPRHQGFPCTYGKEIELPPTMFEELLENNLFRGGYVNNIGDRIGKFKHVLFYQGLTYTTETDYELSFKK